jgi:hypothetical protein
MKARAIAGVALVAAVLVAFAGSRPLAGLSGARAAALNALREVVPSKFGSAKFARLAPGYSLELLTKYPTLTTCGYLPAFVARALGARGRILSAGTFLVRELAIQFGCWRTLRDGLPRPGDFYCIMNAEGGIIHVGVVVEATERQWATADAGQGTRTAQRAEVGTRVFNRKAGTLGGRLVAGWLDIDCFPFGRD